MPVGIVSTSRYRKKQRDKRYSLFALLNRKYRKKQRDKRYSLFALLIRKYLKKQRDKRYSLFALLNRKLVKKKRKFTKCECLIIISSPCQTKSHTATMGSTITL